MNDLLKNLEHEFHRHKGLADEAIASLDDDSFFRRPASQVNSVAIVVKHLAGNLRSRWTDLLTTDGEKPDRDRDNEFILNPQDTRTSLLAGWERSWSVVFATLASLTAVDLEKTITIRGEPHSVTQALLRSATHVSYHTGQIVYLARLLNPDGPWLTIAPGSGQAHKPRYLNGSLRKSR